MSSKISYKFIHEDYKKLVYSTMAVPLLSGMCMLCPLESIKIIGLTTLTGIAYGICNDMIACRDCIEYFTIGHAFKGQELRSQINGSWQDVKINWDNKELYHRYIRTLDPNLNALFWGTFASWIPCAMAGVCLAVQARFPLPAIASCQFSKISAVQISPFLISGAIIALRTAHVYARKAENFVKQNKTGWENCLKPNNSLCFSQFPRELSQVLNSDLWTKWHSCTVRNTKGYNSIAVLLLALSGGLWVARAISPWSHYFH